MIIKYGIIDNNNIDVTYICLSKLTNNNIITIPCGDDNRSLFFSDPLFGFKKQVIVLLNNNTYVYDETFEIKINLNDNTIKSISENSINDKLSLLHSKLKINHGDFRCELPEQKMAVRYLTGKEKVLEIGGNIGRNSLIISSILEDSNNLVTLESDHEIAKQLEENRNLNNLNFKIESSALSKRKLIQKCLNTFPSDILLDGYKWVNTITYDDIKSKYNIIFDTLVLDCEGAFYYILMDMSEILENIKLIIMENDYNDLSHKQYVDKILTQNNFYRNYVESLRGDHPYFSEYCINNFFEVWKRNL